MKQATAVMRSIGSVHFSKPRVLFDDGNEYIHIVLRPTLIDGETFYQILIIEGARDPNSKRRTKEEVLETFETEQSARWYLESCAEDLM